MTASMTDPESDSEYRMRGPRVHPLDLEDIKYVSARFKKILQLTKRGFSVKNAEQTAMSFERYGIYIDVVDDRQWFDATRATVDPANGMIYMPEKLYSQLCRGKIEAIRIFLHEVGHIVLGHRPLLHFADDDQKPTQIEDSEWQADTFADALIELLKLHKEDVQLELKF